MRKSCILMHISSLPSNYGIGKMGKAAFEFVDFLKSAGVKCWQILPILIACVLMTAVNLIMLNTTQDITKSTFAVMIVTDAVVILTALLTAPLFTRLVKVS